MAKFNPEKVAVCSIHDETQIKGFFGEYRWLSNFHLCSIKGSRFTYPSTEHAYQAAKWPAAERGQFVSISCAAAKTLGRKGTLYTSEQWNRVRVPIMSWANRLKYAHPDLAALLLATEERYLEETNWWGDTFWGVCRGNGENHLGQLLMKVRTTLKREATAVQA